MKNQNNNIYLVRYSDYGGEWYYRCSNCFSKSYSCGVIDDFDFETAKEKAMNLRGINNTVQVLNRSGVVVFSHTGLKKHI